MRFDLYRFLVLIIVAALGWAGYWFVGAQQIKQNTLSWFESRQAAGWIARYDTFNLRGFPNRFDSRFTKIELGEPAKGWSWSADFFHLFMLSYKPNHLIAVWSPEQQIATPEIKIKLRSSDIRASLVVKNPISLALERSSYKAQNVMLIGDNDTGLEADLVALAVQRQKVDNKSYRIAVSATGLRPLAATRVQIDPEALLPRQLEVLKADLTVAFDRPWDRSALETARPQPTDIELHLARARWGKLDLNLTGQLQIDAAGWPSGEIIVKASNWRKIHDLARNSGKIPEQAIEFSRQALEFLARLKGQDSYLDLGFTLRDRKIFLGPLTIAHAPQLRLR